MSGKPFREGVQQIRDWLAEIEVAETRAAEIRRCLPEAERLEGRATALRREVIELMQKMDVASNGNYGWEGRVVWFLNALRNSASPEGGPTPDAEKQ